MIFSTSEAPIHFIKFAKLTAGEIKEINDWAAENLNDQMVIIRSNGYFDCLSKPSETKNVFGETMPLAKTSSSFELVIGFVDQADLTSFLIRFQND